LVPRSRHGLQLRPPELPRRRILFILYHARFLRLFEGIVRLLADRGHHVHLAFQGATAHESDMEGADLVGRLCAEHETITAGHATPRDDRWLPLATLLRRSIDYLRYLSPAYANAPKLRARAAREAPRSIVQLSRLRLIRKPPVLRLLDAVLRALERAVPTNAALSEFIRAQRPDIVIVTPLVAESTQTDYVRSAKAMAIRSALCVASWDNLSNKGLIRDRPDRLYVWNEDQVREATELHGVPDEHVVPTGAHSFDHWFEWRPSTTPEEFREAVGLTPGSPILLYLCSSKFVASYEPPFVARWIRELRAHPDARLRTATVLVRPHPKSGVNWRGSELGQLDGVAVWPPTGAVASNDRSKAGYYDSMYHCTAVVGLNTSALIESAIVGRPAFTVLAPEFQDGQEGTLHFHYLVRSNGGPLTVARSFEEHFDQLGRALHGRDGRDLETSFLRRFVRPHGLDRAATPVLVEALERQLAAPVPAPARTSPGQVILGALLAPLAALVTWRQPEGSSTAAKQRRLRVNQRQRQRQKRRARRRGRTTKRLDRLHKRVNRVGKRLRRWLNLARKGLSRARRRVNPARKALSRARRRTARRLHRMGKRLQRVRRELGRRVLNHLGRRPTAQIGRTTDAPRARGSAPSELPIAAGGDESRADQRDRVDGSRAASLPEASEPLSDDHPPLGQGAGTPGRRSG
jgi:hypothetical protein